MGRITERTLPDSTATKYEFNVLGSLTSLTHANGNDILDQFKYTYDPVGNITQIHKHRAGITSDNGLFKYAYDPLNRLIEAANPNSSKSYTYDNLGNRTASLQNGTPTHHSFNARNQLIKTTEADSVTDYSYDKRGNLTQVTQDGRLQASYIFDATNMMTAAANPSKGTAEYSYNGFLKRVKKLENLQTGITDNAPDPCKEVRYILDLTRPYDNLLMTQGAVDQGFVWGNSLLSARGGAQGSFHYLQDHLGSPIRLLGDSNNASLAYDEFGVPEITAAVEKFDDPFSFTGYQSDDVSGLCYAQARYYDPFANRFNGEDRVRDGLNWYQYARANPVRFVDRNGHVAVECNETWWADGSRTSPPNHQDPWTDVTHEVVTPPYSGLTVIDVAVDVASAVINNSTLTVEVGVGIGDGSLGMFPIPGISVNSVRSGQEHIGGDVTANVNAGLFSMQSVSYKGQHQGVTVSTVIPLNQGNSNNSNMQGGPGRGRSGDFSVAPSSGVDLNVPLSGTEPPTIQFSKGGYFILGGTATLTFDPVGAWNEIRRGRSDY